MSKSQTYIEEGLRRMKVRKAKRKEKRLENKRRNYWSATWYENGKMMQRCEYYGSCEFPCNGDC
jgi:antitoxin component YwqK of YwqJK toxin-antitoxin module